MDTTARRPPRPFPAALAAAVVLVASVVAPAAAGTGEPAGSGDRHFLVYRPPGGGQGRPLVVYLHACTQTADDAARTTGFRELAARERFIVVFPEQDREANALRCWNWFSPAHQDRDAGEPAVIAAITRAVAAAEGSDRRRIYVAGLSAGGAMAVVMGATWPDLYAAVAVAAGCEFQGLPCAAVPSALPPEESGRRAFEVMSDHARPVPVMVIQGDRDRVVPPENAKLVVRQWIATADLADDGRDNASVASDPANHRRVTSPGRLPYEAATWAGPGGGTLIERWLVEGLGHAWPGGSPGGSLNDPTGPDATAGAWRFFTRHPLPR